MFASPIERIDSAIAASDPRNMWASLRIIPPSGAGVDEPWSTLDAHNDEEIIELWQRMASAWQSGDSVAVNAELENLATVISALGRVSQVYPEAGKLRLESLYFRLGNLTWVWLFYLTSVVLLLMSFVYRFDRVGRIGIAFFCRSITTPHGRDCVAVVCVRQISKHKHV